MKKSTVGIIVLIVIAAGGTLGYFFYKKKNSSQTIVTKEKVLAMLPESDKALFITVLDKMTQQEMEDTYKLVEGGEQGKPELLQDKEFIKRIDAISSKYNIFT